jgi:hypothetical protein
MSFFSSVNKTLLLTSLLISSAHSDSAFPKGCEVIGFGYEQRNLIINETGEQSYYLIQNRSESKIELERNDNSEAFMTPPLQASLDSMNWAAFASDVRNVNFKCYKHVEANTSIVDCRDVLDVCQYPRVRFALSNMGNYWISTNKSQKDVINDSVAKGIYLKW